MTNQPAGTPDVRRFVKYDDQYSDSFPKSVQNKSAGWGTVSLPLIRELSNSCQKSAGIHLGDRVAIKHEYLSTKRRQLIELNRKSSMTHDG